uniref:Putative salivary C type lectin n=1 Tax=Aedes aegypti TaxID=7159 RepID=Q1HQK2_AEDAE|nr:putative salivary C type lectin [Aedes aegypti]
MLKGTLLKLFLLCLTGKILKVHCHLPEKYHVVPHSDTWFGAYAYCKTIGMNLATINSAEEQKQIVKTIKDSSVYSPKHDANLMVWIDATRVSKQSKVQWFREAKPLVYSNWGGPEPDDTMDCVHMWNNPSFGLAFVWKIGTCSYKMPFVCETSTSDTDCIQTF